MWHSHSSTYGSHQFGERAATKVLQNGFWWPTLFKYCKLYVQECIESQKTGNISKQEEMRHNGMLEAKPLYYWGIKFMGIFLPYNSHVYIILCVGYTTK